MGGDECHLKQRLGLHGRSREKSSLKPRARTPPLSRGTGCPPGRFASEKLAARLARREKSRACQCLRQSGGVSRLSARPARTTSGNDCRDPRYRVMEPHSEMVVSTSGVVLLSVGRVWHDLFSWTADTSSSFIIIISTRNTLTMSKNINQARK